LKRALDLLFTTPGIFPHRVSSVYLTKPVGFSSNNWFYNLVVSVWTSLSTWELMLRGLEIEIRLGRVRGRGLADRVVDLDLLFYDEAVIEGKWVQVPHPRLHERAFVLVPLSEIAPDLKHPLLGQTVRELLLGLEADQKVFCLGSLIEILKC